MSLELAGELDPRGGGDKLVIGGEVLDDLLLTFLAGSLVEGSFDLDELKVFLSLLQNIRLWKFAA